MKLFLFAICTLFFTSTLVAQNVNIPDAIFKNYLVTNTAINTNGDSEISVAEANAFTGWILISNKGIADLTGIEAFIKITRLDCSQNTLTSLDVSKNIELTVLECASNLLNTINATNNPYLTYLSCYSNKLTILDVSHSLSLNGLLCYANNLTTLDVSKNIALTDLFCAENKLTSLNVDNNLALIQLRCFTNNLTSLNVNKNKELTELQCGYNKITELDVTNNIDLTILSFYHNNLTSLDVSKNKNLTQLLCSENNLTSLDVTHNTDLSVLWCSRNSLTSIDISNNKALTQLTCEDNELTFLDLSINKALTVVWCGYNNLTSLNIRNGNNSIIDNFICSNNPNLYCISVDNVAWSTENWKTIDSQSTFNTSCFDNYFQAFFTTNTLAIEIPFALAFSDQSGGKPTSWFWDFGDDSTSTMQNPIHTFKDTGVFEVKLLVTKGTATSTYTRKITATKRAAVREKINPFAGKARSGVVSFVIDTMAYVGLGRDSDSCFTDMWQFNPLTDTWKTVAPFPGKARSGAVSFVLNTEAYVGLGGNQISSTVYNDFYSYNPKENKWKQVANYGGTARTEAVAFAIGDTAAYVGTGSNYLGGATNEVFADFWKYNPKSNIWSQITTPTQNGRKGAMGFAIEDKGYLTGGDGFSDMQEYSPVSNTWKTKIVGDGNNLNNSDASVLAEGKTAFICYGNKKKVVSYNPQTNIVADLGDVLNLQAERYDGVSFLLFGAAYFGQGVKYGTFTENYQPYYQKDIKHIDLPFVFAPEDILLSNETITENSKSGTVIGILKAIEKVEKDSFTYELIDVSNLYIEKDSLKAMATNYEKDTAYNITVKTTDSEGNTFEKAFTIKVKDINEAPWKLEIVGDTVLSGSPLGTLVGRFKPYDEDTTDTHTFKFDAKRSDADTAFYSITGDSLVVADTINKDDLMHSFYVLAIDKGGLELSKQIFIDIIEGVGIRMVESAANQFDIYPNPVSDFVIVQSKKGNTQISELVLLNAMGKVVSKTENINAPNHSLPTVGLKPGIYILLVRTQQGTYMQKLVKE